MKTRTKIWLDEYLIGFAVKAINLLVILAGKLLRIDHRLDKDFKVLAICKYKGMGSILQSTPLLRTLRASYPEAKIVYISSTANAAILRLLPEIDEVILLNDNNMFALLRSFFPFCRKLIAARIEILIDLEVYSNFSTLMTIVSLATNRMGFYLNSKHYRMGNYTHMMYYNTRSAISETYLQFARLLQCQPLIRELSSLKGEVSTIQLQNGATLSPTADRYLLLNPNASDLRIERRWPADRFKMLINLLYEQLPDYQILLVGAPSEAAYVDDIVSRVALPARIYSVAGKTSIPQLIGLIAHASLLITNDTGPMHIAFATRTPTVALFGPCSPEQYGRHANTAVIYANLYCSPCVHEFAIPPCRGNNLCMKTIAVTTVFNNVIAMLEKTPPSGKTNAGDIVFEVDDEGRSFTVGTVNRADN